MMTRMMKRSTKESVQDALAGKELYVSVSKTPSLTKLIWHLNPPNVTGADNADTKRAAPEGKYLQILSACLTAMVLWGIFWQVHNHLVPQLFHRSSAASSSLHDALALAQIQANAQAFQGGLSSTDLASSLGGRGVAAKHLLELKADQIPDGQQQPTDETSLSGSLWPVLHRKFLSELDYAPTS